MNIEKLNEIKKKLCQRLYEEVITDEMHNRQIGNIEKEIDKIVGSYFFDIYNLFQEARKEYEEEKLPEKNQIETDLMLSFPNDIVRPINDPSYFKYIRISDLVSFILFYLKNKKPSSD